jgi:hypothetical protein
MIFERAERATNDVNALLSKLVDMAARHPFPQNGFGCFQDAHALLAEVREVHKALGAAIVLLKDTPWPSELDYREATSLRQNRRRR